VGVEGVMNGLGWVWDSNGILVMLMGWDLMGVFVYTLASVPLILVRIDI
jgi:hypothetical protein